MEIEVEHTSTASPDAVWAIMTDLERSEQVLSTVTAIERVDGGDSFGVGTTWRESRVLFGREGTEVLTVTAIDHDDHNYVVEAENGGTRYVSRIGVRPAPAGAELHMSFGAEATSMKDRLLARTIGRAFEGATRSALETDLREIAEAAEQDDHAQPTAAD